MCFIGKFGFGLIVLFLNKQLFIAANSETIANPPIKGTNTPSYTWVSASGGKVPKDAVVAGIDDGGGLLYVGRVSHESGDVLPGKIIPSRGGVSTTYHGYEVFKSDYEVLCGPNVVWQLASNGEIPENAIVAGQTENGENLYIGRIFYKSSLTFGKVHPSHKLLYIPFSDKEVGQKVYEVAVAGPVLTRSCSHSPQLQNLVTQLQNRICVVSKNYTNFD